MTAHITRKPTDPDYNRTLEQLIDETRRLPAYLKTEMPDPVANIDFLIIVTNEVGGRVPAFSDGTNWRRVTDRAVVS